MWISHRLIIRHFTLDDWPFIIELVNSPPWIENIGDRGIHCKKDAQEYLLKLIAFYKQNPLGLSCIELKGNHTCVGMCGLIKRPELDHLDLGYALLPNYFGLGYAFEAVERMVNQFHTEHEQDSLFALVKPQNGSSIRILEKIGFSKSSKSYPPDTSLSLYEL